MSQLLSEKLEIQSNEIKQRFFSTPLSQSARQWQRLSSTRMLDGFPVGVAFLDENLVLRYQNSTYAEYMELYTAGGSKHAEGRCFFDYLPGSRRWTEPSFRYVIDTRTTLVEHDHEIRVTDGQAERQTFWNGNLAAMIHPDKTLAGVVLVCQDTSFERLMINHLVHLEHQIQELTQRVEDAKKAIRFLSDMRIEDQRRFQESLSFKMTAVVLPLLELLKKNSLKPHQKNVLQVVCATLDDLAGFGFGMPDPSARALTPKETKIHTMVKAGRTTKEIAEIMCVSAAAVSYHRSNIRKKLGRQKRDLPAVSDGQDEDAVNRLRDLKQIAGMRPLQHIKLKTTGM